MRRRFRIPWLLPIIALLMFGLLAPPGTALGPFVPMVAPLLYAGDASLGSGCSPNKSALILAGCGTPDDPYVLENIEIVFRELLVPALEFRDTTKHVVVRNVFVHDIPYIGIMVNGDNVTLDSVVVARGGSSGIKIGAAHMVSNVGLHGSIVIDNVATGVSVDQGSNLSVLGSRVQRNADGINIGSATAPITIKNNDVSDNRRNGIYIHNCCGSGGAITIDDNVIAGNSQYGILVSDTIGMPFHGNDIEGNALGGLRIQDGSTFNVTDNWWGAADGPSGIGTGSGQSITKTGGTVLWDPYLTMPNPSAGPSAPFCTFMVHAYECALQGPSWWTAAWASAAVPVSGVARQASGRV